MIGRTLSHYEILEQIGAGGMGVVYKARDTRLGRHVALKFLPPQFSNPEMKQRFHQEARAASALDHPSICTVHDIDETDDGHLFIVMGYYAGQTLQQRLASQPLSLAEALEVAGQVGRGLAAAHQRNIVHRDIKPANILLTDRNEAKILDFGLAKVVGSTRMTRTGTTLGTLTYMSPEQLSGGATDHRADIWAFGAVLFETLTGDRLIRGDSEGAVVYAILHQELRAPSEWSPGLPPHLDRVVLRCLSRDPEERYASMDRVLADLETDPGDDEATRQLPTEPRADDRPTSPNRLAVLDFANYVGDPATDWLGGGIAESVTVDLRKLTSMPVIGRGKVAQMVGSHGGAPTVESAAARLGVDLGAKWIVWGAFQKAGEAIRVTAHFLDVSSTEVLGSVKLDGSMSEIFELQDRIIEALAESVDLAVTSSRIGRVERPRTADLEAFEYCARGRQLIWRLDPANFAEAQAALDKAVELDPEYALAHSGLGQLHSMRFITTTDHRELELAIGHLQRANELDPELADPYVWLSYDYSRLHRFKEAVAAGRRAIELDEENSMGHYFLGVARWLQAGLTHDAEARLEAIANFRRAIELSPKDQPAHQILGDLYQQLGLYDQAQRHWRLAVEIEQAGDFQNARFVGSYSGLGILRLHRNDLDSAEELLERGRHQLASAEHVYAKAMLATTLCALSELAWRRYEFDLALRLAGEAGSEADRTPNALGIGWFRILAHLGKACAFQRLAMRSEAAQSLEAARTLMETKQGYDFSGIWNGGDAVVWYQVAQYHALSQHPVEVGEALRRAAECGWRELPRLEADPVFATVRHDADIIERLDAIRLERQQDLRSLGDDGVD